MLSSSTRPRIMSWNVALGSRGQSLCRLAILFEQAKNNVFSVGATGSKSTTSASAKVAFVNLNFALAEMDNALAKCSKYLLTVFLFTPAISAICNAAQLTADSLTIFRILASEIFERVAYFFYWYT